MNPTNQNASRLFFILGAASTFLLALLWSVDRSVVYIFLGISAGFFFLAWWKRPQTQESFTHAKSRKSEPTFESFFRNKTQQATTDVSPARTKAIVTFIFIGGIIFFFAIVFTLVVSGDGDSIANFEKAESFRWSDQYDSAKLYYRRDLAQDPSHTPALTGLGNVFLNQENYDSSKHFFSRALTVEPESQEAKYGLALSYYYLKDYRTSLRQSLSLVRSDPEYMDAVLLSGDNYYVQDRYDSAMFYYEQAFNSGTKTAGLYHVMAYIYDTQGKTDKAIPLYKEAVAMDSTRVGIYDRMAELEPSNATLYKSLSAKWKEAGQN